MGTPYSVGYTFERRVRQALQDQGWVVFKSGGSRSPVDLVALKAGEVLLIQVKVDGILSPRERGDLALLRAELGVRVFLAYRGRRELKWLELLGLGSLRQVEMAPEKKKERR